MGDREALGVTLQLTSAFAAALAYVLQKAAHLENEKLDASLRVPLYKRWKWSLGLLFMVASAGCAVVSAPMLDQSKQATLGAATIVFNGVLAWIILKDALTVLDAIAIITVVLGTAIAMATAEPSASYIFSETVKLLEDGLVYAYLSICLPLATCTIYIVEKTAQVPREQWSPRQRGMMQIAPPLLGGWCNNQVLYCAKVVTTVVFGDETEALKSFAFYVYVAIAACAVYGQVRWLNTGLEFFPASLIVPVFQVMIILGGAGAGIVYYHDMRYSGPDKMAAFGIGALVCAMGIVLLQIKARRQQRFAAQKREAVLANVLDPLSAAADSAFKEGSELISANKKDSAAANDKVSAQGGIGGAAMGDSDSEASIVTVSTRMTDSDADADAPGQASPLCVSDDGDGSRSDQQQQLERQRQLTVVVNPLAAATVASSLVASDATSIPLPGSAPGTSSSSSLAPLPPPPVAALRKGSAGGAAPAVLDYGHRKGSAGGAAVLDSPAGSIGRNGLPLVRDASTASVLGRPTISREASIPQFSSGALLVGKIGASISREGSLVPQPGPGRPGISREPSLQPVGRPGIIREASVPHIVSRSIRVTAMTNAAHLTSPERPVGSGSSTHLVTESGGGSSSSESKMVPLPPLPPPPQPNTASESVGISPQPVADASVIVSVGAVALDPKPTLVLPRIDAVTGLIDGATKDSASESGTPATDAQLLGAAAALNEARKRSLGGKAGADCAPDTAPTSAQQPPLLQERWFDLSLSVAVRLLLAHWCGGGGRHASTTAGSAEAPASKAPAPQMAVTPAAPQPVLTVSQNPLRPAGKSDWR